MGGADQIYEIVPASCMLLGRKSYSRVVKELGGTRRIVLGGNRGGGMKRLGGARTFYSKKSRLHLFLTFRVAGQFYMAKRGG